MNNTKYFGTPMPEFRTDYGTLKSRELENILVFLNKRGILIANCFDRKVIIVNPYLVDDIRSEIINTGFQELLIGATLTNIRKVTQINLAQNRVLELLTPGALIINRENDISIALPDSSDLRDLCEAYGGTLNIFISETFVTETDLVSLLKTMKLDGFNKHTFGVLEYPYYDADPLELQPTVVTIRGLNNIQINKEGSINKTIVEQSLKVTSLSEIGEW